MQFAFNVPGGGRGITRVRTLPMLHWKLTSNQGGRFVFRPTLATLPYRLKVTFVAALFIGIFGAVYYGVMESAQPIALPGKTAEAKALELKTRALFDDGSAEQAFAQAERNRAYQYEMTNWRRGQVRTYATATFGALAGLLGFAGLLAPASLLWNRLAIFKDQFGNLHIKRNKLFGGESIIPVERLGGIDVSVKEQLFIDRELFRTYHQGWRWRVALLYRPEGADFGGIAAELWPYQQKDKPLGKGQPPQPVRDVLDTLAHLTGLSYGPPRFVEVSNIDYSPWRGVTKRYQSDAPIVTKSPVEWRTYDGMDDIPAHLRESLESMANDSRSAPVDTRHLPPHIREHIQHAEAKGVPVEHRQSMTFSFKDANGNTVTYNNLDEMPPQVRAMYEQAMRRRR